MPLCTIPVIKNNSCRTVFVTISIKNNNEDADASVRIINQTNDDITSGCKLLQSILLHLPVGADWHSHDICVKPNTGLYCEIIRGVISDIEVSVDHLYTRDRITVERKRLIDSTEILTKNKPELAGTQNMTLDQHLQSHLKDPVDVLFAKQVLHCVKSEPDLLVDYQAEFIRSLLDGWYSDQACRWIAIGNDGRVNRSIAVFGTLKELKQIMGFLDPIDGMKDTIRCILFTPHRLEVTPDKVWTISMENFLLATENQSKTQEDNMDNLQKNKLSGLISELDYANQLLKDIADCFGDVVDGHGAINALLLSENRNESCTWIFVFTHKHTPPVQIEGGIKTMVKVLQEEYLSDYTPDCYSVQKIIFRRPGHKLHYVVTLQELFDTIALLNQEYNEKMINITTNSNTHPEKQTEIKTSAHVTSCEFGTNVEIDSHENFSETKLDTIIDFSKKMAGELKGKILFTFEKAVDTPGVQSETRSRPTPYEETAAEINPFINLYRAKLDSNILEVNDYVDKYFGPTTCVETGDAAKKALIAVQEYEEHCKWLVLGNFHNEDDFEKVLDTKEGCLKPFCDYLCCYVELDEVMYIIFERPSNDECLFVLTPSEFIHTVESIQTTISNQFKQQSLNIPRWFK